MLAYTYVRPGVFELKEKPLPQLQSDRDAIVKVTLCSICTSRTRHQNTVRCPGQCRVLPWAMKWWEL